MNKRIKSLMGKMIDEPRVMSIEQAVIITNTYKENENDSIIIKRAKSLKNSLEKIEIKIDTEELIVGNRTKQSRAGVVFPEGGLSWLEKEVWDLPTREQDKFEINENDIQILEKEVFPYWKGKTLEDKINQELGEEIYSHKMVNKINQTDHAQGHIIPNVEKWLEYGPLGLYEQASAKFRIEEDLEKKEFYQAMMLALEGANNFINRYALLAINLMESAEGDEKRRLEDISNMLTNLSKRPPETFHEAVQLAWFLFVILQMESNASSFSPGRMDQYLYRYYKNDIDRKLINREDALEIIECLFLKFNQIVYMRSKSSARYFAGFPIGFNIAIGGQNENGIDSTNDLSYIFLDAQYDLGLPQPNLSVRLHDGTPDEFLRRAVEVVARGSGMPQFFNDNAIIKAMKQYLGIERKDAYNYGIVGCVELTTQGNNLGWSDAAMFNFNKALEYVLTGGVDLLSGEQKSPNFGLLTDYDKYEDLESSLDKAIDYFLDKMIKCCEDVEVMHGKVLPSVFLSSVIDSCMDKGIDVTKGGAKYNLSGIQMIQIANLADSLAAIKHMVYQTKEVTKSEMLDALRTNFDSNEVLRQKLLNKVPKYGNNINWVDDIGVKWARKFADKLGQYTNHRGGKYHTGMYTVSAHVPMGQNVGASPDGRLAREPLADGGMSPVYGRDIDGPTSVLNSVSKLDNYLTTNGGLLNMKFLPSFFETESGVRKFMNFLRTFVDLEIPHIQFNVVNRESLIKAQKNPEAYRNLTIRVAGYTAYFVDLADDLQDEIIARTEYSGI